MIGIYKITSPTGRVYVGQSVDIDIRFEKYKLIKQSKSQVRLHRSFKKYDIKNHTFEILEECDEKELNNRERHYQDLYNVTSRKGLNCKLTKSDDKSGKLSQETRNKISNSNKGKIRSKETKLKLSLINKGKKLSTETREKIRQSKLKTTDETKLKMSNSKKSGKNNLAKKVICTETKQIWDTITDCALDLSIRMKLLSRYLNNVHPNKTSIIYLKDYEKQHVNRS